MMFNHIMEKPQEYCDMYCIYAQFPKEDLGSGRSCRTFDVLYCSLLEQNVLKNDKCKVKDDKQN